MGKTDIYSFEKLLHSTNNLHMQPEGTYRSMWNSYIVEKGENQYAWQPMDGNSLNFSITAGYSPIGFAKIKKDLIVIFSVNDSGNSEIGKIVFTGSNGVYSIIKNDDDLDFSIDYPIEAKGYYESDEYIWVHWIQDNKQPRAINIAVNNSNIDVDLYNYSPEVVYPTIKFNKYIDGSLQHGRYFFFTQYTSSVGQRTDFSIITKGINITEHSYGTSILDYQNYQGENPSKTTNKGIRLSISNIDTKYDKIRVGYFYSDDEEVYQNGVLFAEKDITGSSMTFDAQSMVGLDIILLEDVLLFNQMISTAKAIEFIKNYNVLGNVSFENELSSGQTIPASVAATKHEIFADEVGVAISDGTVAPLIGESDSKRKLRPGLWYRFTTNHATAIAYSEFYEGSAHPINSTRYVIYCETKHQTADNTWDGFDVIIKYTDNGVEKIHETTITTYTNATNSFTLASSVPFGFGKILSYAIIIPEDSGTFIYLPSRYIKPADYYDVGSNILMPVLRIKKYFDYATGNQVYDEYDLDDDWLDYKGTHVSQQCMTYKGNDKVSIAAVFFNKQGKPFAARDLGSVSFPEFGEDNQLMKGYDYDSGNDFYARWNYLVNNITINDFDVTDIIDDIGSMLIVRSAISRKEKSSGILVNASERTGLFSEYVTLNPLLYGGTIDVYKNFYAYYSPEHLFNKKGFSISNTDNITVAGYLGSEFPDHVPFLGGSPSTGWNKSGIVESSSGHACVHKCLRYVERESNNSNGNIGNSSKILTYQEPIIGENLEEFDSADLTKIYTKELHFVDISYLGYHGKHLLIKTDQDESSDNIIGEYTGSTYPKLCYVKHISTETDYNEYNPIDTKKYVSTGRYIIFDDDFIDGIQSGSDYIINNLEIFGGDSFASLFDFVQCYAQEDVGLPFGRSLIIPIISEINIALRQGNHIAKTRSYNATYNPDGLRFVDGAIKIEDHNYNDGYTSSEIDNVYPALSINYRNDLLGPYSYVWSEKKVPGEIIDSYRIFKTANRRILDSTRGVITAMREYMNILIIWKEFGITYVPVGERALINASDGMEVQLGSGTELSRYDDRDNYFGTKNKFSIIGIDGGFLFIDVTRLAFCILSGNGKAIEISAVNEFDQTLISKLNGFDFTDNPYKGKGIFSSLDPKYKIGLISFLGHSTDAFTLQYSVQKKTIIGYDQRPIALAFENGINFYTTRGEPGRNDEDNDDFFIEHQSTSYELYNGWISAIKSSIELVLNKNPFSSKTFDILRPLGTKHLPTSIKVKRSDLREYDISLALSTDNRIILDRRARYDREKWKIFFRNISRERTRGEYISITIKNTLTAHKPIISAVEIETREDI